MEFAESRGLFVTAFDTSGQAVWARGWGPVFQSSEAVLIAASPDGGVVVASSFSGLFDFTKFRLANPSEAISVVKLDAAGAPVWARRFGQGYPTGLAVDSLGQVLVSGAFQNGIDFGGREPLRAREFLDGFVAKLDPQGVGQWSRLVNGHENAIAVAADGSVLLAATERFEHSAGFDLAGTHFARGGDTQGATTLASAVTYLAAFDADGTALWARRLGEEGALLRLRVAADARGGGVVTGALFAPFIVGGAKLTPRRDKVGLRQFDGLVARFEAGGSIRWARQLSSRYSVYFGGLAVGAQGQTALSASCAWSCEGEARLGDVVIGGADEHAQASGSGVDRFVGTNLYAALVDESGAVTWARALPGIGYGLALDPGGDVWLAGYDRAKRLFLDRLGRD